MGMTFSVAKYRGRRPWGCHWIMDSLQEQAYVFLLCWKETLTAQKCDLFHDKWDPRGSEFSTLLSDASAEPALGMHNWTWVSEQVASIRGQKEQRQGSVSEGAAHFFPLRASKRESPVNVFGVIIARVWGHPVTSLGTCYFFIVKVSPPRLGQPHLPWDQPQSRVPAALTCSFEGRKVSGGKWFVE